MASIDKRSSWNKGLKMSLEYRQKVSKSLIGNKRHLGCRNTEEVKKEMSLVHKGQKAWNVGLKGYNAGKKHYNFGKKMSEEQKRKIGLANKGRKYKEDWEYKTPKDRIERVKFRNTIQKQVFQRDNYTCQFCGVRGKDMTVDHI